MSKNLHAEYEDTIAETGSFLMGAAGGLCVLCCCSAVIGFRGYELIAFAMDVDDFDGRVVFEMLAELGDVDVH